MQQVIQELAVQRTNVWCSTCKSEGHRKDECKFKETNDKSWVFQIKNKKFYSNVCENVLNHATHYYAYDLNEKKQMVFHLQGFFT